MMYNTDKVNFKEQADALNHKQATIKDHWVTLINMLFEYIDAPFIGPSDITLIFSRDKKNDHICKMRNMTIFFNIRNLANELSARYTLFGSKREYKLSALTLLGEPTAVSGINRAQFAAVRNQLQKELLFYEILQRRVLPWLDLDGVIKETTARKEEEYDQKIEEERIELDRKNYDENWE